MMTEQVARVEHAHRLLFDQPRSSVSGSELLALVLHELEVKRAGYLDADGQAPNADAFALAAGIELAHTLVTAVAIRAGLLPIDCLDELVTR